MSVPAIGTAPHGFIVLDKPVGLGSTQAVAAVKRNLRAAGCGKVRVGHCGTLDPLACGVLPIALGEATKLAGRMLEARKTYLFEIAFGSQTDTLDGEGVVVARSAVLPTLAQAEAVLPQFTGPIAQVPPAYSALKVAGQRAYDRARAGEAVTLQPRMVTIHALSWNGATTTADERLETLRLVADVAKGTYIRSLARDIALALGTVGHVTHLARMRAGPFGIEQAISLDSLNAIGHGAPLENVILPLGAGLDGIPALDLGPEQARAVRQGRVLTGLPFQDGVYWGRSGTVPVALVELAGGSLRTLRGFNLGDAAE